MLLSNTDFHVVLQKFVKVFEWKKNKQSLTLTGMMCEPYGALAIGSAAGAISVFGYKYLTVYKKLSYNCILLFKINPFVLKYMQI